MYQLVQMDVKLPLEGTGDNSDIDYFILFAPTPWRLEWLRRVVGKMRDEGLSWSKAVELLPPVDEDINVWVVGKRFLPDGETEAFLNCDVCSEFFKA